MKPFYHKFQVGDQARLTGDIWRADNREMYRSGETVNIVSVYDSKSGIQTISISLPGRMVASDIVCINDVPLVPVFNN